MKKKGKVILIVVATAILYLGAGLAVRHFSPWPVMREVHDAEEERFTFTPLGWFFLPSVLLYETLFLQGKIESQGFDKSTDTQVSNNQMQDICA